MHTLTSSRAPFDRLLRVLALLACALAAAVLIEQAVTGPRLPAAPAIDLPDVAISRATEPLTEVDWGLFGEPAAQDYGLVQAVEPTPLKLRLRGAVAGRNGYAIIVDADGNEGVYRVGDELPGDARVTEIETRRVLLRRSGRIEALALPGGAEATAGPARAASSSARSMAQTAAARNGDADAPAGIGAGSLSSLTSAFTLDPDRLAREITILPVAGGGFRVRAGRDAALFQRLGFELNDVVLAINGRPVSTQADVRAVFGDYNPGERIAITVRRGDRQLVLTPDLSGF
ncbi:type II secretion system protein N [Halomonas denitrificans]|nr:PDZ domain-containing protein [Halomonas denitrificans]